MRILVFPPSRSQLTKAVQHVRVVATAVLLALSLTLLSLGQDNIPKNVSVKGDINELPLEQLLNVKVTSASLHEQSVKEAPASVTVISAEDIRKFGYRTLAEALSYVRGFFFTADHTYDYLGVRGFSLPGDYATRLIVLIDGHSIADNIFGQSTWFGNDFPLDMSLVDRIEVIRGSSSALYGSNGMLATINVVTKRPSNSKGVSAHFETGSLGERKGELTAAISLPKGASLMLSASAFNNGGAHQLYFSEFDRPQTNFGRSIDSDGEQGFHGFADFTWGNWEILAVEGDRVKQQPISWPLSTVFNDRGTRAEDSIGFLDVSYTKQLDGDRTLNWRTSYDAYRYRGTYHYYADASDSVVADNREHDYGDWIGTKLTWRMPDLWRGHITTGAELKVDVRALIDVFDVAPIEQQILRVNKLDRNAGVFAQQEWALGKHWEANIGGRFDWSLLKRSALSPRASLIYRPSARTTWKLLASRGFGNPSTYNMYYDDKGLTQIASPGLRPEFANSFETDLDHQITKRLSAGVSAYRYGVDDLIQQLFTPTGLIQYGNQGQVRASGVSFELRTCLYAGIELESSLELQRAVFGGGSVLPNSPGQVGKLRGSMPFWRNRFTAGIGIQALGQRNTYAGATVPWVILPEAVLSSRSFAGGYSFSAGAKNLSNSFYRDPVGLTPLVDSVIGHGRTYYLNLNWHSPEKP